MFSFRQSIRNNSRGFTIKTGQWISYNRSKTLSNTGGVVDVGWGGGCGGRDADGALVALG